MKEGRSFTIQLAEKRIHIRLLYAMIKEYCKGGAGMRYTCLIDGKEVYLFYEDNNMWFMEKSA